MNHRLMKVFAIITAFLAYVMVLMGAIVTITGSGKGCGNSWPLCHGQLIPEALPVTTVLEYSHRTISGADGFLILILTVWSWITFRHDLRVKVLGFLSLFFVIFQGALGALTVVFEGTFAKDALLALHFGFSLISFASIILLTLYLFQMPTSKQEQTTEHTKPRPASRRLQFVTWGLATYTYLVIYTGSLVRHEQATLGCGYQWPFCGGNVLPNLASAAGFQVLHRYSAESIGLLILLFMIMMLRRYQDRRDLTIGSILAFALVIIQGLSGLIVVMSGGTLVAALLHTTVVAALFCVLSYLCMQVGWPWSKQKATQLQATPDTGREALAVK